LKKYWNKLSIKTKFYIGISATIGLIIAGVASGLIHPLAPVAGALGGLFCALLSNSK